MKTIIALNVLCFLALAATGAPIANIDRLSIATNEVNGGLAITSPRDASALGKEWIMVVHYSQVDGAPQHEGFDVVLFKSIVNGRYVLASYVPIDLSSVDFAKLLPDEKLDLAKTKKSIGSDLASAIYDGFGRLLVDARIREVDGGADGAQWYVSVFSFNLGQIAGIAGGEFKDGSAIGRAALIGRIGRSFLDGKIVDEASACAALLAQ